MYEQLDLEVHHFKIYVNIVLQSIERLDSNLFGKGSIIYRPLIITTIASYSTYLEKGNQ